MNFDLNPKDAVVLGGLVVGLYLLWQGMDAAKNAATKVGQAVADGAAAAESGAVAVVGAIGAAAGLPTPGETLSDPRQVRWIIDHVGTFAASQWGTAAAFVSASWLPVGGGDQTPPPPYVLQRLGLPVESVVTQQQVANTVEWLTGGVTFGGDLSTGGPSFSDVASGQQTTNPFAWN